MPETYRVAVIGRTGRGNYGHNIDVAFATHPRCRVIAVADDNPEGLKKAGDRLKTTALYADYRQMLDREKPQIAAVCPRWLDGHLEMVEAVAAAHAHVFMEKPMGPTLAECDRMIDACDRVHSRIAIAHNMRVCPILDHVERQVKDGIIGDLQELRGRGKEDRRAGGEDMMVLGTHVFDLMRRFGGDPQWVTSRIALNGREVRVADVNPKGPEGMGPIAGDNIQATFAFPNGLTGYFASKRSNEGTGKRFGIDLYGSKGVIAIRAGHAPDVWINRSVNWTGEAWQRLPIPAEIGPHNEREAYHLMVDDLLGAIEGDREPQASGRTARWTIEMAMGVYAAHKTGTRVVLPLSRRDHPLAS